MKTRTTTQLALASALIATAAFVGCSEDGGDVTGIGGSNGIGGYIAPSTIASKGGALPGGGTTGKAAITTAGSTSGGGATGTGTRTSTSTQAGATSSTDPVIACGTTPSTASETATFATGIPAGWAINDWQLPPNAAVTQGTTFAAGAATNLCSGGCAILTLPLYAGRTYENNTVMFQKVFDPPVNLVGASVRAEVVVTSTLEIPLRVQLFTQAGQVVDYAWGSSSGNEFEKYTDTSKFQILEIPAVADSGSTAYCASDTFAVGIQAQPVATIPSGDASAGVGGATSTGTKSAAGGSTATTSSSASGGSTATSSVAGGATSASGGATGRGGATGTGTGAPSVQVGTVTVYIKSITIAPPAK